MKTIWCDRIFLYNRYYHQQVYLYRVSVGKDRRSALYGLELGEKIKFVRSILGDDLGLDAIDPEGGPYMEIGGEVGVGYRIENITLVPNFGYFLALTQE